MPVKYWRIPAAPKIFVAQISGDTPSDLKQVSWWNFRRGSSSFGSLSGGLASMQTAAASVDECWPALVWQLRQLLHHRDEIRLLTAHVRHQGLTYATYSTVRLDEMDGRSIPANLQTIHDHAWVQPRDLQHRLVRNLADVLEQIFDATEWPDHEWYLPALEGDRATEWISNASGILVQQWWWQ